MNFTRFTKKNIIVSTLLIILFVVWNSINGGMRTDHYILIFISLIGYYTSEKSRKLFLGFSIFIVYWIIYDSMRLMPNYEVSKVHIQEPYDIEKALFGINLNGITVTPNEYFAIHNNSFLDFLAGLFYVNWVPIPLIFAIYLFYKDKYLFVKFSFAFVIANIVGFALYYVYPAAPPWYVEIYGFDLHYGVPGNSAGLSRFDDLVNFPVFANIFNKNANVLAAMPSVHSINPIIVLYYGIQKGLGKINWFFAVFMIGIWFTAVYSNHHYIIDVLGGIIVGVSVLYIFEKMIKKPYIDFWVQKLVKAISN